MILKLNFKGMPDEDAIRAKLDDDSFVDTLMCLLIDLKE